MNEVVRVRLLLAKFYDDTDPTVVHAVDERVWEHWGDEEDNAWRKEGQRTWGIDPSDCEWKEVWAEFSPDELAHAFATPTVKGEVRS